MAKDEFIAIFIVLTLAGAIFGYHLGYKLGNDDGFIQGREAGLDLYQKSIVTGLVKWTSMVPFSGGMFSTDYIEINHGNWSWCRNFWINQNESQQIKNYLDENFKNGKLVSSDADFSTRTEARGYHKGSYYRI